VLGADFLPLRILCQILFDSVVLNLVILPKLPIRLSAATRSSRQHKLWTMKAGADWPQWQGNATYVAIQNVKKGPF
jgi:hypothetical protein